jgi:PAS domain S-box-containing protein
MSAMFDTVLRKIRIAFVLAALAMVVFGFASYRTIDRLAGLAINAVNTQDKLVVLEQLNSSLSRAQVALRDYVLTGAQADLEVFQARAWEQKYTVEALGTPPVLPEQDELERRISERTQLQYEAAAARGRGDQTAALRVMESIRSVEADAELAALLQSARAREEQAWWNSHAVPTAKGAQQIVVAAGALLVAMFLWAYWMVRRYERERRRVTSLLDDSEAMTRLLASNMAEGLVTISTELVILDMNQAALKVLGYERHEVIGRAADELVHPASGREALRQQMLERLAQPEAFQVAGLDILAVGKDGRPLPVQISLNDLRLGGRRRVTILIRDMSRIRAASEAVKASERHLREITDTLPVIIAEFDTEHRFRFINRAGADFLGMPAQAAIGRPAVELLGDALYAEHKPHLDQVLRGSSVRYEITAAGASVARWAPTTCT